MASPKPLGQTSPLREPAQPLTDPYISALKALRRAAKRTFRRTGNLEAGEAYVKATKDLEGLASPEATTGIVSADAKKAYRSYIRQQDEARKANFDELYKRYMSGDDQKRKKKKDGVSGKTNLDAAASNAFDKTSKVSSSDVLLAQLEHRLRLGAATLEDLKKRYPQATPEQLRFTAGRMAAEARQRSGDYRDLGGGRLVRKDEPTGAQREMQRIAARNSQERAARMTAEQRVTERQQSTDRALAQGLAAEKNRTQAMLAYRRMAPGPDKQRVGLMEGMSTPEGAARIEEAAKQAIDRSKRVQSRPSTIQRSRLRRRGF